MGTACGMVREQGVGLPLRKVEYAGQPTLSEMKKTGTGPFFEMLTLDLGQKQTKRVAKWTALMSRFASDNFPVEAACCDPSLLEKTKQRVLKGVPQHFRWEAWTGLRHLSYRINEADYLALPLSSGETEILIRADVSQTFVDEQFFRWDVGREMLQRVLSKYAEKYKSVGYCDGLSWVVGFMLMVSGGREVEVFYMLEDLMESFHDFYTGGCPYLRQCVTIFLQLIDKKLPQVSSALKAAQVDSDLWVERWFRSLFTAVTPLDVTTRIWDLLMVNGVVALFQVAMALLRTLQIEIIGHGKESVEKCFESLPQRLFRCEELIRQVCKSKFRTKHLRHMEKVYKKSSSSEFFPSGARTYADSEDSKDQFSSPSVSTHFFDSQLSLSSSTSPAKSVTQVPSLPAIARTYVDMEDLEADVEDFSEEETKPLNARDVLEDLLLDPESSVLSLESLSNLPRPRTPDVDKLVDFVNRLPY